MKQVYPPKENSIEYPLFNIFIPYTDIQPATLISLIGYNYTPFKVKGEYGYFKYFIDRWKEGETFINIEQDVVIYPGAIEAIWDCPQEICAYNYHLPIHRKNPGTPLGCVKFSKEIIKKMRWKKAKWSLLDQQLSLVHQHYPSIVNANLALLGFAKWEENVSN